MTAPIIQPVHFSKVAPNRDYDIYIGADLLPRAGQYIHDALGACHILILADEGVSCHLETLLSSLRNAGHKNVHHKVLPEGEGTKSWAALQDTLSWMLDQNIERNCVVVAFGGGVIGDHAGFAAASCLRGLPYVQIPTTLLAQVDSSVGGKTGINMPQGKNLVGAFYQPSLVLADIDVLKTLPPRHMRAGYAEMVKYAFIRDTEFFDWLEDNASNIFAHDVDALARAVSVSCQIKADIVGQDEREGNIRALLNFGHTFAHALEAACDFDRRLLHGEAVAIGMALAFETSQALHLIGDNQTTQAIEHMCKMGLPTRIADIENFPSLSVDALMQLMQKDKKVKDGQLTFILSRGIGEAFITQDVDLNTVKNIIKNSMEEA